MYFIIDSETKVIQYSNADKSAIVGDPEELYPSYDENTMSILFSIPTNGNKCTISEDGNLVSVDLIEDIVSLGVYPVDICKELLKELYSNTSFLKRVEVLPDYKLTNAGLGVYDAATTTIIKDTVEAFRAEYYRLEGEIDAAVDNAELAAIVPNFPTELVTA